MTSLWQWIFWSSLFLIVYTYIGYGFVLLLLVKLKRWLKKTKYHHFFSQDELPPVTLIVAAYNEVDFIEEKIKNTLELEYPDHKLQFIFVTDGSDDGTPDLVEKFPQIKLCHQPQRQGKIAAVDRVMPQVKTPIVVFTDANTFLNADAIIKLVRHYKNPDVGAVAGEKRVMIQDKDQASGAGEGFYWKYESTLKKWDSELHSVVGAAGELFSIRTALFQKIPSDTLIEDFYLTLSIAGKGYKVRYEPDACASEGPSASVKEELKRKIRIATGGIQAIIRLKKLLNPFKYGILSFQYISHRVLRWTIAPVALILVLISNIILAGKGFIFYQVLLALQATFYLFAFFGGRLASTKVKIKILFIPYYFFIMNYAVYRGFWRYFKGNQSVLWERAKRS
ncbi:MAG: glycosyltransferase family 2 protein [Candidatus Cyclobacteriaceae bacterium M3_2C_046]